MGKEDIFPCKKLLDNVTNRKNEKQEVFINNTKVVLVHKLQWLKMLWLRYKSSNPLVIYYKYSNHEETKFSQVNVKKRKSQPVNALDLLYPQEKKIDEKKKNDLLSLPDFIPPIKHKFYHSILSGANVPETTPVDDQEEAESEEEERE